MTVKRSNMPRQTASNAFEQPARQFYQNALRMRRQSMPELTDAGFLTKILKAYIKQVSYVSAEAVIAEILALASQGLTSFSGRSLEKNLGNFEVPDAVRVIETARKLAETKIRSAKTAFLKEPASESRKDEYLRAKFPEVMVRLTGEVRSSVWDAENDGHLCLRDVARSAGIVRWALAQTQDRRERVNAAIMEAPSYGHNAALCWHHRRPIVFIEKITAYTAKLVLDAWAYDAQICVVCACGPTANNPFEKWQIPVVFDTKGHIRALLGVDHLPCVIEPRIGGYTLTAGTGLLSIKGLKKNPKLPAWLKTLAEIGLLQAYESSCEKAEVPMIEGAQAPRWQQRFEALFKVSPSHDAELSKSAFYSAKKDAIDGAAAQRKAFSQLKENLLRHLEICAAANSRDLEKAVSEVDRDLGGKS